MIITNLVNDISFPNLHRPMLISKKDIRDITILDSNRIEISFLGRTTESRRNALVVFYDTVTAPVTASITELRDLLVTWKDNQNIDQAIEYDCADGLTKLGSILKPQGNMLTLQILYTALSAADSIVSLYQSSDGINWDPILDASGVAVTVTLLSTQSSTINAFGVAAKYVAAFWTPVSVATGTINYLKWRVE